MNAGLRLQLYPLGSVGLLLRAGAKRPLSAPTPRGQAQDLV